MIFHPFEISFCGFSNSGKTTLICSLVQHYLAVESLNIVYIKHDAHHFEVDKEGKDTWRVSKAGAKLCSINDADHFAIMGAGSRSDIFKSEIYKKSDFVLIEGFKKEKIQKMVFVDPLYKIFDEIAHPETVVALIYNSDLNLDELPVSYSHLPRFHRNDVRAIADFIFTNFSMRFDLKKTKGLILAGGQSRRMGQDKSALNYGIKPQTQVVYDLLKKHCQEVYVSCRNDQINAEHLQSFSLIEDRFIGFGPLGGILSAQLSDPTAYWLVAAVDLPLLCNKTLETLVKSMTMFKCAVAYHNIEEKRIEPLCAIYAPFAFAGMLQMLGLGYHCPQKYLWNSNTKLLSLETDLKKSLENANTPIDFARISLEFSNEV